MTWEDIAKEYVQTAAPVLAPVLAMVAATLLLRLVYSNKENAKYVGVTIALLRASLSERLQGKADAVLDAWDSAVKDAMSDKPATKGQALDAFMHSISGKCKLTADEALTVRGAAALTFDESDAARGGPSAMSVGRRHSRVHMLRLGK